MAHGIHCELHHSLLLQKCAKEFLVAYYLRVGLFDIVQTDAVAHEVEVFEGLGLVAVRLFVAGLSVVEVDFRQTYGRIDGLQGGVVALYEKRMVCRIEFPPGIAYAYCRLGCMPRCRAVRVVVAGEPDLDVLVWPVESVWNH